MSQALVRSISEVRARVADARRPGSTVGLVPTMGALHAGHGALIEKARAESGFVVVSVFVNPIQFDRKDDYERYARTLPEDLAFSLARGADLVFAPPVEEMYPAAQHTTVEVAVLSEHLCGRFRPGHFRGVATVVAKLFLIVQPDRAYFGEKDAQQLAIVRRMAADLNFPVEIVPVPTVREPDGLALSSRNQRLSPEERAEAPVLFRALEAIRREVEGGCRAPDRARQAGLAVLSEAAGIRVEYLEIVDPREMQPVSEISGPVLAAGAVWLGGTRLIDNVLCVSPRRQ